MDVERCVSCGEIIPEGKQVCLSCEIKAGMLKNKDNEICEWLYADLDEIIDMC